MRYLTQTLLLGCCVALSMETVYADTLFMKNGVQIHGKIVGEESGRIVVQTGRRTVRVRKDEVARIEENDRDGIYDREAARRAYEERDRELTEETGLNREQRDQVRALFSKLSEEDALIRNNAHRALVEMAAEQDIFGYLTTLVESALPWFVPGGLHVLAEIDAQRAHSVLRAQAHNLEERARATAVELLGVTRDRASLPLMMRGLLDHAPVVRMAACSAVTAIAAFEATPMLIDNLEHADLRVHNYAREALQVLWSEENAPVAFDTVAEWKAFWSDRSATIPITVDVTSLEPLVEPGAHFSHC